MNKQTVAQTLYLMILIGRSEQTIDKTPSLPNFVICLTCMVAALVHNFMGSGTSVWQWVGILGHARLESTGTFSS